jgi:cytochrome c-type biogenesis protein CcmE
MSNTRESIPSIEPKLKPRTKRAIWIIAGLVILAIATALVLNAFNKNLVFFFTPSQIANGEAPQGKAFRIGGLVENGTLQRRAESTTVVFTVTDKAKDVKVEYTGILPDLFKEGRGVVAQGKLGGDGIFRASEVLAKHDENYMPPEAAEALKKAGQPIGEPTEFKVAPKQATK